MDSVRLRSEKNFWFGSVSVKIWGSVVPYLGVVENLCVVRSSLATFSLIFPHSTDLFSFYHFPIQTPCNPPHISYISTTYLSNQIFELFYVGRTNFRRPLNPYVFLGLFADFECWQWKHRKSRNRKFNMKTSLATHLKGIDLKRT